VGGFNELGQRCRVKWRSLLSPALVGVPSHCEQLPAGLVGDRGAQIRDWRATPERFVDPETGRLVTVFFNATTGEGRYVAGRQSREAQEGSRGSPVTPPYKS
jgi:hypothetical protein